MHLVAVPESEDGLRRAIGEAHRRYTRRINFREGWRGHLWQGRFASFPMDEAYLMTAARYVELNPVRAKLCRVPWAYKWSSAAAYAGGKADVLATAGPLLERLGVRADAGGGEEWKRFLLGGLDIDEAELIRRHERTGRPLGSSEFVERLERMLGRPLRRQRPGPKPADRRRTGR